MALWHYLKSSQPSESVNSSYWHPSRIVTDSCFLTDVTRGSIVITARGLQEHIEYKYGAKVLVEVKTIVVVVIVIIAIIITVIAAAAVVVVVVVVVVAIIIAYVVTTIVVGI